MNPLTLIALLSEISTIIAGMKDSGLLTELETTGADAMAFFHASPQAQDLVQKATTLIKSVPATTTTTTITPPPAVTP